MIKINETFGNTFPFKPHFYEGNGFKMHYVDEGSGEIILCLHGEPSWGYLYRFIIPLLSKKYRVIVPDHMGFGKSETPQDKRYDLDTHVENLEGFIDSLGLSEINFILHDWGGSIGAGVMLKHPEKIKRFIGMNITIPLGLDKETEFMAKALEHPPYFKWMRTLYDEGNFDTVLSNFGTIVLSVMHQLQGFQKTTNINAEWIRAYSLPFETPEESIGAISFPKSVVSDEGGSLSFTASSEVIKEIQDKPSMFIMGMRDKVIEPQTIIPLFKYSFPKSGVYELPDAGHFLQEDEPQAIASMIDLFIRYKP